MPLGQDWGQAVTKDAAAKGPFALARQAGLNVASVELTEAHWRDVLLIERFDRPSEGGRRLIVSALTMLGLDEMDAAFTSTYADLGGGDP